MYDDMVETVNMSTHHFGPGICSLETCFADLSSPALPRSLVMSLLRRVMAQALRRSWTGCLQPSLKSPKFKIGAPGGCRDLYKISYVVFDSLDRLPFDHMRFNGVAIAGDSQVVWSAPSYTVVSRICDFEAQVATQLQARTHFLIYCIYITYSILQHNYICCKCTVYNWL